MPVCAFTIHVQLNAADFFLKEMWQRRRTDRWDWYVVAAYRTRCFTSSFTSSTFCRCSTFSRIHSSTAFACVRSGVRTGACWWRRCRAAGVVLDYWPSRITCHRAWPSTTPASVSAPSRRASTHARRRQWDSLNATCSRPSSAFMTSSEH